MPVNVITVSPVPPPVVKLRPVNWLSEIVPLVAVSVTSTRFVPTSGSSTRIGLPFPLEKMRAVSSAVACGPGTVLTGASFTACSVTSRVSGGELNEPSLATNVIVRVAVLGLSLVLSYWTERRAA